MQASHSEESAQIAGKGSTGIMPAGMGSEGNVCARRRGRERAGGECISADAVSFGVMSAYSTIEVHHGRVLRWRYKVYLFLAKTFSK